MTVASTLSRVSYMGTGALAVFHVPFVFYDPTDLIVFKLEAGVETTLTLGVHYSVSGGSGAEGDVTTIAPYPSASVQWTIVRQLPLTQTTDYQPNDPFPAQSHETALDRAALRDQQIAEAQLRSLKFPASDSTSLSATIPASAARASMYLGFDASGVPVALAPPVATTPVSSFMATALDDTSAAEARTTLGAAAVADVWSTGDIKLTMKTAADSGWVLCNDTSIGNAGSGATGRANADTAALYTLLWDNVIDTWAPVSGGRGASAAADFAALKTLTLPRTLGRALAVFGTGSGLTARVLGEFLGTETHALTEAQMPAHTHTIRTTASMASGTAGVLDAPNNTTVGNNLTSSTGSGSAHPNMQPTSFVNAMLKL